MKYVYLAGPISGLSYNGCTDWRSEVSELLNSDNVECLSPMRGKDFLKGNTEINLSYKNPIATAKAIMGRDHFDTCRATVVMVNLLEAKRVSIGTCMELAWAFHLHIPTIVLMEEDNIHQHPMVTEASTYLVSNQDEGVKLAKYLLNEKESKYGKKV